MTKARDLANLASTATVMATDAEVAAAVAPLASTTYVDTAVAAADSTPTALMTMGA
jgi:hypothetical protein